MGVAGRARRSPVKRLKPAKPRTASRPRILNATSQAQVTATRDREGAFEASSPCADAQGENGKPPHPDPRVRPLCEGTAAEHPACVSARRRGPADPRPVVSRAFWTMSAPPSPQPRVPVSTKEGGKAGSRQGGAIPASSPRANSKVWEGDGAESRIPRAQKQGAEPGSRASRETLPAPSRRSTVYGALFINFQDK